MFLSIIGIDLWCSKARKVVLVFFLIVFFSRATAELFKWKYFLVKSLIFSQDLEVYGILIEDSRVGLLVKDTLKETPNLISSEISGDLLLKETPKDTPEWDVWQFLGLQGFFGTLFAPFHVVCRESCILPLICYFLEILTFLLFKKMSNVKKSKTWTMEVVHKKK